MPSDDKQIYLKVSPALYSVLQRHWRLHTEHRHLSDLLRDLLITGALERGIDVPDADRPTPPAAGSPPD